MQLAWLLLLVLHSQEARMVKFLVHLDKCSHALSESYQELHLLPKCQDLAAKILMYYQR